MVSEDHCEAISRDMFLRCDVLRSILLQTVSDLKIASITFSIKSKKEGFVALQEDMARFFLKSVEDELFSKLLRVCASFFLRSPR